MQTSSMVLLIQIAVMSDVHRRFPSPWLVAVACGLLAGIALPPLGWPPLLWLALAGLWSLTALPPKRAWAIGGRGFAWGTAAVALSHRWLLALHPLDWIGVPGPLSLPLCLLLLALISALGGSLVALWLWLATRLDPRRWTTALLLALLWGLGETLLAKGPLFWLGLGAVALPGDPALAGLAALGGSALVGAVQLLMGWLLWRGLAAGAGGRQRWLAAAAALVLISHGAGALALSAQPLQSPALASERVLVLQTAIPTREKLLPSQRLVLQRRLWAALAQGQHQAANLVVLPEGALGIEPQLDQPAPLELIGGGFRWHEQGDRLEQRSSLLRFQPGETSPSGWLDKHRLVPLGEWVPLAGLVRWAGLSAVGGVEPGPASRLLARPAGPVAGMICYELADGAALAQAVRTGALWLLASANLDPYPAQLQRQFVALAQLRAIETGRWLVSAANTGPSMLINPRGQVVSQLPPSVAATAQFVVMPLRQWTPYVRWGDTPLLLLALALAVLRALRPQPNRPLLDSNQRPAA